LGDSVSEEKERFSSLSLNARDTMNAKSSLEVAGFRVKLTYFMCGYWRQKKGNTHIPRIFGELINGLLRGKGD